MSLRHLVLTSVDRDDLPDFGAWAFAETIRLVHERVPGCSVEVLVPDFQGNVDSIRAVLEAGPEIYNHNTETVPRLYKKARPGGRYERVLEIFRLSKSIAPGIPTKTGMILGMGETNEEVLETMRELREVDVDILTLGQYLRPSNDHIALDRYVTPDEFRMFYGEGMRMGFRHVESAPLVRSSYHAWEQVAGGGRLMAARKKASRKRGSRKAERGAAHGAAALDAPAAPLRGEGRPKRTRSERSAASATCTSDRRRSGPA